MSLDVPGIIRSAHYGGEGGISFDDTIHYSNNYAKISQIDVREGISLRGSNRVVEGVRVMYDDGITSPVTTSHGGEVGTLQSFKLELDENIVAVSGRCGRLVDQICFHTSKGRSFGPVGGDGGQPFNINFGEDRILFYLFGRGDAMMDALGFAFGSVSLLDPVHKGDAYGCDGGNPFDDFDDTRSKTDKITAVRIRYGQRIDAIQMQYNGEWGVLRGGQGGNAETFSIPQDDFLVKITGSYDHKTLRSISFQTQRGLTSRPFGVKTETPFTIAKDDCAIVSIHGRHGRLVDKLGGYFKVHRAPNNTGNPLTR